MFEPPVAEMISPRAGRPGAACAGREGAGATSSGREGAGARSADPEGAGATSAGPEGARPADSTAGYEPAAAGVGGDASDQGPAWDDAHRLAVELDGTAPGLALARRLSTLIPAEVDDAALVEAIAAWERIASWAAATQAAWINELRRRRDAQGRGAYVGDEVAARLATSRAGGETKVGYAIALERVPEVWDALAAGVVDLRRSRVLCDELLAIPEEARGPVTRAALDGAGVRTAEQLRARVRRAALRLDPNAADQAHRRARADRHVELHPVHDGMAWLHAFLPAHEAVAVHTALTAMADAQAPEDPRPMDARRADALVDAVTRWLDAGTTPDGAHLPTRQRRRPHLSVTASATTLLGLDDDPCELAGYGPISAEMAREIAAGATWTPLLLDAETGHLAARGNRTYRPSSAQAHWIVDRDSTCTFPGCRVPASRCDIDHNTPFDPARPAEEQTVADGMDAKCRHHHRLKTLGGWVSERDVPSGETTWTAPTGHRYTSDRSTNLVDANATGGGRSARAGRSPGAGGQAPGANGSPGSGRPPGAGRAPGPPGRDDVHRAHGGPGHSGSPDDDPPPF